MYRPGKPAHGPRPFGPPLPHGPPFRPRGPCGVPPPGHLPPGPCGPFSASTPDSHFLHSRPPRGHFVSPHCSSFSIDHSTVIAMGGNQQIALPAEPPPLQIPRWNLTPVEHRRPDNSDRASEEFLRCIAANKPLPDYLKGNMAYNLADALKSTDMLKEALKSDPEFQKHVTRSKSHSRSRSRGKSRGRSRGRSRGKSRAKSHARSKSRTRSRSRGRNKSRVRGKSHARSKSRARSRSRSESRSEKKSHVRSKSRIRRSKSRSSSSEKSCTKDKKRKRSPSSSYVNSSNSLTGNSLLEGLKLVMNSKELEERLPSLKDAILTIQASDKSKTMECVLDEYRDQQHDSQDNLTSLERDSMLLPHDRVGSDFSWLQVHSQEDFPVRKAEELEDEESFLYGNEEASKPSTTLFAAYSQIEEHAKLQERDVSALCSQRHHQKPIFSSFGDVHSLKQTLQIPSSNLPSATLDSNENEKIKNILKSMGTADISDIIVKMQGQKEEKQQSPAFPGSDPSAASLAVPALSNPNVRQALESLQSLIKATKEKRSKSDSNGTSLISDKHKAGDDEERKREKQARICKMESLVKELEGLLKQDGMDFLTPVIGFYCHTCEEFIGDLNCAENHATTHKHNSSSKMDKHTGDSKGRYFSNSSNQHHSDSRHNMPHGLLNHDHKNNRDHLRDSRNERDHSSKPGEDVSSHRARQENMSLKDEMKKERMLITVSCGLTPSTNIRVKEELSKEQASVSHSKVKMEETGGKGTSSKDSRGKDGKGRDESSDSTDKEQGKSSKAKSQKKKKKKEKKKKKKKEKGDRS